MAIPIFPQFKSLQIDDKEEVEVFFRKSPFGTSDFSFTNLYIWRDYDFPKLSLINDNLCILMNPHDSSPYFLPPVGESKIEETLQSCLNYLKSSPQIRMVTEKFAKKYFDKKQHYESSEKLINCDFSKDLSKSSRCEAVENRTAGVLDRYAEERKRKTNEADGLFQRFHYQLEIDRNNCDYLYRVSDLIHLKGRKYDGKRNWIKRFLANYSSQYVNLTPDLIPSCFDLLERWEKTRSEQFLNYEIMAIKEALNNINVLGLTARAILISGKPEAFMVGGLLNQETAIVYIQVASRQIQGLPQYFHQEFTAEEFSQYKYVNWEQDLGLPGLRRAKLSYQPKCLLSKYNVGRI